MQSTLERLFRLIERPFVRMSHRHAPGLPALCGEQIGSETGTGLPFILSANELRRHCYLIGSTGVGKTNLVLRLLEQDVVGGHSVVVVDMRGDLVSGALGLCASLGVDPARVSLLDLREKDRIQGFDPLSGAGEPYVRALHLSEVIAQESGSWGVQLEETLRNCLLLLASAGEPLTKLESVLYDDGFREKCLATTDDESLAAFWERYSGMGRERRQTWALPVLNKVTPLLATPTLRSVLSGSPPLDLARILGTEGSVLLVSLAVDELHRSSRMLGSLVVSSLAREMFARVNVPERSRNPVRLYVDEFENMASESFENLIAEGRRFGLTLVMSHQTLSQMPPRLRSVIRNNVGVQVIFQVGFEDATVISKEVPKEISASDLRRLHVGQAYAMWRDGDTVHVSFSKAKKAPTAAQAEAFRSEVLPRTAASAPVAPKTLPTDGSPHPALEELL
ncbi:MAG: type IV secretion system DNA-binding domain-containing protein [Armatimonadetes bacterium]|nr:type IV secretion system DNA-binding domain-containing protein [Armatimonadota bacterium]